MRRCRLGLKASGTFMLPLIWNLIRCGPHLTNGAAFGILSVFLPLGGNGSVCSASKAIEGAGRRIFYFLYGDNQYGMGHARHCRNF